jgi:hypothetical protein
MAMLCTVNVEKCSKQANKIKIDLLIFLGNFISLRKTHNEVEDTK